MLHIEHDTIFLDLNHVIIFSNTPTFPTLWDLPKVTADYKIVLLTGNAGLSGLDPEKVSFPKKKSNLWQLIVK